MSVGLTDKIEPKNENDEYGILDDKYFIGGLRIVESSDEMNAITTLRRKEGMLVLNLEDEKLYILKQDNFELYAIDTSSKYGIILSTEIIDKPPSDTTFYSSQASKTLLDNFSSIVLKQYDTSITYKENEFVFKYDTNFKIYQCIKESKGNDVIDPAYWKEITLSTSATINYGFGLIFTDGILSIDTTKIITKWEQKEYNQDIVVLYIDDGVINTGLYKSLKLTTNKPPHEDWELIAKLDTNGSGEVGTSNYEELSNRPQINSIELIGDKTGNDLGLLDLIKIETTVSGTQGNVPDSKAVNEAITINEIKLNNTKIDPINKSVNIGLDKNDIIGLPEELEQIKNSVTQVFTFKGQVTNKIDLDGILDKVSGDVYYVESEQTFYVWDGTEWTSFVPSITSNGNTIRELVVLTKYQQGEFVIYKNKIYKVTNTFTTSDNLDNDLVGGNLELRIDGDGGITTESIRAYKVTKIGDFYHIHFEKDIIEETNILNGSNLIIKMIENDTTIKILSGYCSIKPSIFGVLSQLEIVDDNNANVILYNLNNVQNLNGKKIIIDVLSETKPQ